MEFRVLPIRITLEAQDEIPLPAGEETNVFRGALGLALRKVCCVSECPGARACERAAQCGYARIFEPQWNEGPSGYRDAPRPFVLRWTGPSTGRIAVGATLSADLNLFEVQSPPLKELAEAFRLVATAGIGPARGRAVLRSFGCHQVLALPLRGQHAVGHSIVVFATPTEIKSKGAVCEKPEFPVLIDRLAERIWTLGHRYQQWTGWDNSDLLELSRMVRLTRWDWDYQYHQRRSSRTGQRHSLGGFIGTAAYEGPVGVFQPLLEIARWTGVGRQTVWGKGEVRLESGT